MRYLFIVLCVFVLLAGLLFGALNPQTVAVDLYFLSFELSLGVALLLAVLTGALLGGLCAAFALLLRRRRVSLPNEPVAVPDARIAVE